MVNEKTIEFYTSYYSMAAISGIESAKSINKAIKSIESVNFSTFSKFQDAVVSRNNLFITLRAAYENVFTNALSTNPMSAAFDSLSKYILESNNQTLDEYLTEKNIKVSRQYANISRITSEEIGTANIK